MDAKKFREEERRPAAVDSSRRAFLRTAVAVGVAAAAGETVRAWGYGRAAVYPGEAFPVDGARELRVGQAVEFTVPGSGVKGLLVRTPDGLLAVDRRCPHLGCPVLWSAENARFDCPCHRAAFDGRTGAVLHGPPPTGLRRFAVEERGAEVWLRA